MKLKKYFLDTALVFALMGIAHAETPFVRCVTTAVVSVATLPMAADKMWHELPGAGGKTLRSSTGIWFKLPKGTDVDLFVGYVDRDGVEWAWASGTVGPNDAIVSGWVRRSSLKCPQ
jgi:hypothetical protein